MVSSEFTYIAESVYQLNDEKQSWKKKKKSKAGFGLSKSLESLQRASTPLSE